MKKMRIKIGNDGRVTMRVEGAEGETCLDFTRAFERAVGSVEKRVMCEAGVDEGVVVREERHVSTHK
jgi:hypothetical protein